MDITVLVVKSTYDSVQEVMLHTRDISSSASALLHSRRRVLPPTRVAAQPRGTRYFFMHNCGPETKTAGRATRRMQPRLRTCLIFILGAVVFCAIAIAAPAKPAGQSKDTAASEVAGSDTCATCHEEVAKGFASNPHTKMAQMHGKNGVTCENCHGAGKAHADDAD